MNLVIVESPAKAKTINNILGRGYRVVASMGHVRDLPRKKMGVDVENNFRPTFHLRRGGHKIVERLRRAAEGVDAVYLATDLDREGEAIAWHVLQLLRLPQRVAIHRIVFHEITPSAIQAAIRRKGKLNDDLVEAQQTRRILDRLVGYSISPLLWKRITGGPKGLSAGRVQTVALRLVVDREREIEAFVPVEYWSIEALLAQQIANPIPFLAKLWKIGSQDPDLKNRDDAEAIVQALEGAIYWVEKVSKKRQSRRPWPPFITSTMQQAAAKMGWPPKLTMKIAQQLYEGVKIGDEGSAGLITYMRTDSTYVAQEAQTAAREIIAQYWGEDYLPQKPPIYKTRSKSAQEAHEAIRPTDVHRTPKNLRPCLDKKQDQLYTLIWRRFIASQMKPAVYDVTTALIPTARGERGNRLPYLFRARGRVLVFDGFLKVYEEKKEADEEEEKEKALPALTKGEGLDLLKLIPQQHWTKPPPRYTEARLIKELERRGIGRPSTFASMVDLIKRRGYVERRGKVLVPLSLGFVVCDSLVAAFPDLFDYGFTAQMEDRLDAIANGRAKRVSTLEEFWIGFSQALSRAKEEMPLAHVKMEKAEPTGEKCPKCGSDLVRRKGKYGYFLGCSDFPRCKYVKKLKSKVVGQCPQCGGELVERKGKRGKFWGCSNYPDCTYTQNPES